MERVGETLLIMFVHAEDFGNSNIFNETTEEMFMFPVVVFTRALVRHRGQSPVYGVKLGLASGHGDAGHADELRLREPLQG